mgnify:CR=1 FL=1
MGYDPLTAAKLAAGKYLPLLAKSFSGVSPRVRAVHELYSVMGLFRGRACVRLVSDHKNITGLRVLDFGCGDGGFAAAFAEAGAEVTALDYNDDRIERLTALMDDLGLKVEFIADRNYGATLASGRFDVIICNDVIEHVDEPQAMVAAQARLLAPDGLLYLVSPSRFSLRNLWSDPHYQLFGVSLMGRKWGTWYTVSVRRAVGRYTVHHLYRFGEIISVYRRAGVQLTCASDDELRKRMRLRDFSTGWRRALAAVLPEEPTVWFHRHFIRPSWVFIGRKS